MTSNQSVVCKTS